MVYTIWQHPQSRRWFVSAPGLGGAATSARGYATAGEAEQSADDLASRRGDRNPEIVMEDDSMRPNDSMYQTLRDAGLELDHHESDLYVRDTPRARELTAAYKNRQFFVSQDGSKWIDLPFAYDRFFRRNARGGELDEHAATELKLYIDNTAELMGPRSQGESIRQNLLRKIKKGNFDLSKSVKLWEYLTEAGAKQYAKEFGEQREWHTLFSVPTRRAVAKELAEEFYAQVQAGEWEEHWPKSPGELRRNASRRSTVFDDQEEIHPEVAGFRFYEDFERSPYGYHHKDTGMVVMIDEEGRDIYLVNPLEVPMKYGGAHAFGYGRHGVMPYILWFGQVGTLRLFIWADSLDSALEEAGETLADHFPGFIMTPDDPELKVLYDEAREELGPDADDDEVYQQAEADLTYTESGYITSYEWGIESDPEGNQWLAAVEAGTAISKWLYTEEHGEEE